MTFTCYCLGSEIPVTKDVNTYTCSSCGKVYTFEFEIDENGVIVEITHREK